MPLPEGLNTVTVTGTFRDAAGAALAGSVTFTPSAVITDADGKAVLDGARTYWLAGGSFTSDPLMATDAGLAPVGWTYVITVAVENTQPAIYEVTIPHAPSPADISALIAG